MHYRRVILFLLAALVRAQSLRVVSEFQRVDPFGQVVNADRTLRPREILSPAVMRNAFASFHIAVTVPPRTPFFLFVQTNPENSFEIALYEALYTKTDAGWIPDVLAPVKLPCLGSLPYLPLPIEGQNTLSYWLDVWVPARIAVDRVRLEVLMKIGSEWVMYPMEVRVMPAVAPTIEEHPAALPPVATRADASVYGPFRNFLCAARETGRDERLTVRRMIHRNALQDVALARALEPRLGKDFLHREMLRRAGGRDASVWCRSLLAATELGTEWYLRVRDWLYGQ